MQARYYVSGKIINNSQYICTATIIQQLDTLKKVVDQFYFDSLNLTLKFMV